MPPPRILSATGEGITNRFTNHVQANRFQIEVADIKRREIMEIPTIANRRTVMRMIGAGIGASVAFSGSAAAHRGGLKGELAEVRSATAEYNDPANAIADGYIAEDHAVCGMGYHYPDGALLEAFREGTLDEYFEDKDRTTPQVLVYGEDDSGDLILGAVEYLVPKDGSGEQPDFFSHDDGSEVWGDFGPFWSLHVWVHTHNPKGVFNPTNPRKQFCPEGSGGH